ARALRPGRPQARRRGRRLPGGAVRAEGRGLLRGGRSRARPRRGGPAPDPALALAIAEDLGVTGMLAVELFETAGGEVLVNELAMRPHNAGHWSMDGAVTGQ